MADFSTLCYMEKNGQYLMLHRIKKKNDVNKDKWIGIGGHFEAEESPEDCLLREVYEETGFTLTSYRFRGLVTFISGTGITEYMSLYTADAFTGEMTDCNEGVLEWVKIEDIWNLNIWEGDKIFFRLMDENEPFFSLKLVYDGSDKLIDAVLNGKPMELFDILNPDGTKTGLIRERGVAHREGSIHATAHIWVVGPKENGYDVLLQKRSLQKDSFPGCYDTSAAGHIRAGDSHLPAAIRELSEELGIQAEANELTYIGTHYVETHTEFNNIPFHDKELSHIYIYDKPVDISSLHLQAEEVDSVCWMDMEKCLNIVTKSNYLESMYDSEFSHCIEPEEFQMLYDYLYHANNASEK